MSQNDLKITPMQSLIKLPISLLYLLLYMFPSPEPQTIPKILNPKPKPLTSRCPTFPCFGNDQLQLYASREIYDRKPDKALIPTYKQVANICDPLHLPALNLNPWHYGISPCLNLRFVLGTIAAVFLSPTGRPVSY